MNAVSIVAGRVLRPYGLTARPLGFHNNRIIEAIPAGCDLIDADGLIVTPGFVDLQVNGGHGIDLQGNPDYMWELGQALPRSGVTSFLPTFVTGPPKSYGAAMMALSKQPSGYLGAHPVGLHFEGPFLSPNQSGMHHPAHLSIPSSIIAGDWSRAAGVALVTLAPELPSSIEMIRGLASRGVAVSAGHSSASAQEADEGFNAGVSMVTNLFYAMEPLDQRSPNLAGAALARDEVVVGIIADGVHTAPLFTKLVWHTKGPTRVALVTNAVSAMGRPAGSYELAGQTIISDGQTVKNRRGALAGTTLTMDRAVRNLIEFTQCDLAQALVSASATPTSVISVHDRGHLHPGAVADITFLRDDLGVELTICSGQVAYLADGAEGRLPRSLLERHSSRS